MIRLGLSVAAAISVIVLVIYSRPSTSGNAAGKTDPGGRTSANLAEPGAPAAETDRVVAGTPLAPRRFASPAAREEMIARVQAARADADGTPPKTYDFAGVDVARTLPAPRADLGNTGTLDKDYIRERIGEIVPLVAECYELARVATPDLEGSLAVDFVIDAEEEIGGYVAEAAVAEDSELRDPALDECVTETVKSLEFPPPEGGGTMRVRYPFQFASE